LPFILNRDFQNLSQNTYLRIEPGIFIQKSGSQFAEEQVGLHVEFLPLKRFFATLEKFSSDTSNYTKKGSDSSDDEYQ
jgi:hypothetical protein